MQACIQIILLNVMISISIYFAADVTIHTFYGLVIFQVVYLHSLSIHSLMDIHIDSTSLLCWIGLRPTRGQASLIFWLHFLCLFHGNRISSHIVNTLSIVRAIPYFIPEWVCQSAFPPILSNLFTAIKLGLVTIWLLNNS